MVGWTISYSQPILYVKTVSLSPGYILLYAKSNTLLKMGKKFQVTKTYPQYSEGTQEHQVLLWVNFLIITQALTPNFYLIEEKGGVIFKGLFVWVYLWYVCVPMCMVVCDLVCMCVFVCVPIKSEVNIE